MKLHIGCGYIRLDEWVNIDTRSDASKGNDFHGQANLRNFNTWAERNGISKC